MTLKEVSVELSTLKQTHEEMMLQRADLQAESIRLKALVEDMRARTEDVEAALAAKEGELRAELEQALDLTEKQNALTVTLETKVSKFELFS